MFGLSSPPPGIRGRHCSHAFARVTLAVADACLTVIAGPGCSAVPPAADKVGTASQSIVGSAGDVAITTAATVVNRYTALATNAAIGATTLQVADAPALAITAGDLLFVVQMQGAQVDGTNTAQFGNVTSLNGAGSFEMVTAQSVNANAITLAAGCGLRNAYSAAAHTQVIWVPQYATLTVTPPGSITAPAWGGTTGGIVVIQAQTAALAAPGSIDVSGKGFRGGALTNFATGPVTASFQYRSLDAHSGAEKGESIAGFEADYDVAAVGGRYALGAIANGGGGGAAHNGGGGGGANGNNGRPWSGAGMMPAGVVGGAAWALDPDDIAAGGLTNASGGGRGGYSFSSNARDPLTVGPGSALWGGDNRQYRGGLGGRPLANDPLAALFVGGGGGAGNENNAAGGAGGAGGGSVVLVATTVAGGGTGSILADGAPGISTPQGPGTGNDGPGGGGAGGSILVAASTLTGLALTAPGGAGGNQFIMGFGNEAEGPGGGGGGGFIAIPTGATAAIPTGGAGGTTNSPALVSFPRNGATDGAAGQVATLAANAQPPMCIAADLGITIMDGGGTVAPGTTVTYTIVATNVGPNPTTGATVTDAFGGAFTSETWMCIGTACPAPSGTGSLAATLGALPAGANVTFTVIATVSSSASGTLSNTAAVAPPSGITDGVPGNDSATVTNTLGTASADIGVVLSHSPSVVVVGATYSYLLAVSNLGPADAAAVIATLVVPAGAVVGTITAPGWNCTTVALTVTCTIATIAAGASAPIAVSLMAPAMAGAATATATITATTGDPSAANNVSTDSTQLLCSVDTDCGASSWCTSAGVCSPKLSNGQPLPSALPIASLCTAPNGIRVCLTGACDANGAICGVRLGDGTCTATTQCIGGVCIGSGPNVGKCQACATSADCAAPTPTCNPTTNGCFACNGDNATATTAPCATTTDPYCTTGGACAKCTANADCAAGTHAGALCNVATGVCTSACQTDAECGASRWCNDLAGPGICKPKVSNGQPVPGGACTTPLAMRACVAGVCDTSDNACGYKNGDGPCTSGNGSSVCRSAICATSGANAGRCEECNATADCPAGNGCNAATNTCSRPSDAGPPDAGIDGRASDAGTNDGAPNDTGNNDAAVSDASLAEAGILDGGNSDARANDGGVNDASAFDAGAIDASIVVADGPPLGGRLEGGGCSCETMGTSRQSSLPGGLMAAIASAGLLVHRRRRVLRD